MLMILLHPALGLSQAGATFPANHYQCKKLFGQGLTKEKDNEYIQK